MSSQRSLLLQLPGDILHTVYSEWLSSWRDLSCLDVGCIGEGDRELWLSSLSELKMREGLDFRSLSDDSMIGWYEWVISRKVYLMESFPLNLNVFADLSVELDYGNYCPALCSLELVQYCEADIVSEDSSKLSVLEKRLYLFLRECINLEGVRYDGLVESEEVRDIVFSALKRGLKENTLQLISIEVWTSISTSTVNNIRQFLAKHLSSMHDLELISQDVDEEYEESIDGIISILHQKTTPLKKLCLNVDHLSIQKLLYHLSSVAMYLEVLEIPKCYVEDGREFMKGDIFSYLGKAFPRLKTISMGFYSVDSNGVVDQLPVKKLLELYESCPNLITVSFGSFSTEVSLSIEVNESLRELRCNIRSLTQSRDEKEIFLECLCLALQRSPCKLTVSSYSFCDNLIEQHDDWVMVKSKLSHYLTDLRGVMSESILIEAVKDLPLLESLAVNPANERLSDLSLAAILEHGYSLKTLSLRSSRLKQCSFSDEMISKVIRSCKMLEELSIPGAGQESVLAVKHHSRLREVDLFDVKVSKKELSRLLLMDETDGERKCVWRRLQEGKISGKGYIFEYNKGKRCWV